MTDPGLKEEMHRRFLHIGEYFSEPGNVMPNLMRILRTDHGMGFLTI